MTHKIIAGLIGLLLTGLATAAEAAGCPAAPQAQIAFEAAPSPLPQDTSVSSRELAIRAGSDDQHRTAGHYDASFTFSARRDTAIAKLPDGTICAALAKLTVKVSIERKLWLASELKANDCVLQAFATLYGARPKADDETVAAFGQTIAAGYQGQVSAIGWQSAKSQDDAMKAISEKLAPMLAAMQAKLEEQRAAAQSKIDLSKLPADSCGGATDKLAREVGIAS